jgi:hypothetical protein
VQRHASDTGVIIVAGQKVALGWLHKHQTVTVIISETILAIQFTDSDARAIRRPARQPVRSIRHSGRRSIRLASVV